MLKQKQNFKTIFNRVTAQSFIVYDLAAKRVLLQKNEHLKTKVGALTKIITFDTVLYLCEEKGIEFRT